MVPELPLLISPLELPPEVYPPAPLVTVIAQVAVKPPSTVVAVMVALPEATVVTLPELFTVATA